VDSYGDTATSVVIYEDAEPNYLIGTSTGSHGAKKVLASDETQPCRENAFAAEECKAVRVKMSELSGHEIDTILVRAFEAQQKAGYPLELISVKAYDTVESSVFTSQSTLYERSGANLKWRVIVTSPAEQSTSDSITLGNTLFGVLCVIGGLGVVCCLAIFFLFYWKRTERAVIYADWRFTCAFILGCTVMNGSTFTLLGPNTDATCMLRMWSFHFCFVLALSPLFAKVWRMKKLVGETRIRRVSISHTQATSYALPIIAIQIAILSIFSIVDPPKQTEIIEDNDGVILQHLVCAHDTNAFFIVALIYEGALVLLGCILSYMTRNLDAKFGESKQLIFAMYNIAFIGVITILLITLLDVDPNGESMLQAIGVFWGTVFSSAIFVLPRMMQVRADVQSRTSSLVPSTNIHITGLTSVEQPSSELMTKVSTNGVGVSQANGGCEDSSPQSHTDGAGNATGENHLEPTSTRENGDDV
jgi:predicted small integral membrane protein